jgi:2-polyprenyl-6-methoxyphenol hydroxylase-like FAD-dependent oxidoreductase
MLETTNVLVVGAGPTGLALSLVLQQAGIKHVLIDRLQAGQNTSRAAVIHSHTLEELEPLGVVDTLRRRALILTKVSIRDRGQRLLSLNFADLPTPYPMLMMIPQDSTEAVLREKLEELGDAVRFGHSLVSVDEDGDGYRVRIATPDGERQVSARYVVGADGMHSLVREQAGIAFEGSSNPETFVLADVRMDWSLGAGEVSLFFSAEGPLVVAPLPDGRFRIVATMAQAPEHPGIADIQRILDERGPSDPANRVRDVIWSSRFRVHHRIASRYRNAGLFIIGDATHVHSPAGGQGMNTGLVDAVVLGRLLAGVINGDRIEADLERYEQLRRPAALEVLDMAHRLTSIAVMRGPVRRLLRNGALRLLDRLPVARRRLTLALSGLSRRASARIDP